MKIVITAGGTGGHIFPALSVALEFRQHRREVELLWVGTERSREKELASSAHIPIELITVSGIRRSFSLSAVLSVLRFISAFVRMVQLFRKNKPDAVIAFGGYVCAPVLSAARLLSVPYFLQEQNTVPGMVNRIFSSGATCTFLGFPIIGKYKLSGPVAMSGTPVRPQNSSDEQFEYPDEFDRSKNTILICGGSQGALSMNRCLVECSKQWAEENLQIVWQTGSAGFKEIQKQMANFRSVFIYDSIPDLYPFYAAAKVLICRAGASTLSEAACFGLPCIMIPLPWATENHQWMNAGAVEQEGWGIRVEQQENCGTVVRDLVDDFLHNEQAWQKMHERAQANSRSGAARKIVNTVMSMLVE